MHPQRFLALLILLSLATPAHAYVDPASGSAIMSVIVGAIVALGLSIKTFWYRLKRLFARGGRNGGPTE